MNKCRSDQYGIAHLGLILGAVGVILIVIFAGYRVSRQSNNSGNKQASVKSTKIKAKPIDTSIKEVQNLPKSKMGAISGTFVQANNSVWPTGQREVYIGLNAGNGTNVSKVEWLLVTAGVTSLRHTATKPSVGNLFQYNWDVSGFPSGTYHWIAKVYDVDGKVQLAKNNNGDPYLDMSITQVETPGTVSGTFVQRNDSTWPAGQREIYIGLNAGNSSGTDVSKVEWYVNDIKPETLLHSVTRASVGNLFQFNWNIQSLSAGKYRVQVKVYDSEGHYQLAKNNNGDPYLDTTIVK